MKNSSVYLLRNESYDTQEIEESVRRIFAFYEINSGLISGKKVAVKPNLLTTAAPESGIITHPVIILSVIKEIKKHGGIPVLVESPGFHPLERVLKKIGLYEILVRENISIADTKKTVTIHNPGGRRFKSFQVAADLEECDVIINLPKMKTHGLTYFTGAVKNLFGTINGLEKSKWHFRANNAADFTSFLLDLYGAILLGLNRKMYHIMDGVIGLEGEGPGAGGRPVAGNAIVAGDDALAVDSVAIVVAGLQREKALTWVEGSKRGYGVTDINSISVHGEKLDSFNNRFAEPEHKPVISLWPLTSPFIKNIFVEKPLPQPDKCTLCYQCRTICPAGAISKTADKRIPHYNYNRCIRCFCCMEICPENAIVLKKGILSRLIK